MRKLFFFTSYQIITLLLFPIFLLFLFVSLILRPAYRWDIAQRFACYPSGYFDVIQGKKVFWIHAASVGEVLMSRLFVRSLKERFPDAGIIYSTITPTGREAVKKNLHEVDLCIYLPFDLYWIVRSLVKKISPVLFIFLETEIWPNTLLSLSVRQIPSIMINGRISKKSFPRYRMIRPFLSIVFKEVSLFLIQTKVDAKRMTDLGAPPDRVEITGNMKYDQAASNMNQVQKTKITLSGLGVSEETCLMIAGSTRPGEENMVLHAYKMIASEIPSLVLIIAPRHLDRLGEVEQLISEKDYLSIRKGKITGPLRESFGTKVPVILLDTIGELGQCYPLGKLIFVGGSLVQLGGHNILEPAFYSKPIFFGPNMSNFQEIADQLKQSGGGIEVRDGDDMGKKMLWLAKHPEEYQKRGTSSHLVVMKNQGAVGRNLKRIIDSMKTTVDV